MPYVTTANPAKEKPLGMQKLADRLGIHSCTIMRWATRGAGGVILETMMLGSRRVTTEEAYQRFAKAINQPKQDQQPAPEPYSPRKHYSKAIRKELKELGLA